jgi:hypothetical protein
MPPRETLTTAGSRPNSEALAACAVLTHPRAVFHSCMCELRRGAAALIGYCQDDHEEETIVIEYFLYTDARLRWIATPTLLPLLNTSSGNNP